MNDLPGTDVLLMYGCIYTEVFDMRRLTASATVVFLGLVPALGAAAGGTWLHTVEDSYDPGDEVTAVAYVGTAITDDPLLARMSVAPIRANGELARPGWIELGQVTMEPTGLSGYLETRVSITFTLPEELEPGSYVIEVRTASGEFFGDLLGTEVIVGGAAPSEPRWFEWALDDPLIEELPDNAVIAGPGFAVSVVTLRAGQYPAGADAFMLHPEDLPPITSTVVPPSVVEEPSAQEPVLTPAFIEEPSLVTGTANVDAANGFTLGTGSLATSPPSATPIGSDQPSEDVSNFAGIAVVAGTMLVALLALTRRSFLGRRDRTVEAIEPERVLTRT